MVMDDDNRYSARAVVIVQKCYNIMIRQYYYYGFSRV